MKAFSLAPTTTVAIGWACALSFTPIAESGAFAQANPPPVGQPVAVPVQPGTNLPAGRPQPPLPPPPTRPIIIFPPGVNQAVAPPAPHVTPGVLAPSLAPQAGQPAFVGPPVPPHLAAQVAPPPVVIPPPPAIVANTILAFDADTKEYQIKSNEVNAHFTFYVTNVSSEEVLINALRPSCGCTAAKLPEQPWRLAAGKGGPIEADMNIAGKHGTVIKSLTVETSKGNKYLTLKALIPEPQSAPAALVAGLSADRARNVQLAQADRQAVLRNDCAVCHVTPAVGKMGKELYVTACAICHNPEHRASMVPDLQALNKPTTPEYWREMITIGKAQSLMPAFATPHGGFLSAEQITSLVDYLVRDFPKEPRILYHEPAGAGRMTTNAPSAAATTTELLPSSVTALPPAGR
jgi:mono/diheme cytochrome c family protein